MPSAKPPPVEKFGNGSGRHQTHSAWFGHRSFVNLTQCIALEPEQGSSGDRACWMWVRDASVLRGGDNQAVACNMLCRRAEFAVIRFRKMGNE
jgi:hypothetical protein